MDVFTVFKESIEPSIKKGFLDGQYGPEVKGLINGNYEEKDFQNNMKKYIKSIAKQATLKMLSLKKTEAFKPTLKHIEFSLIAFEPEKIFGKKEFNFNAFYDNFKVRSAE